MPTGADGEKAADIQFTVCRYLVRAIITGRYEPVSAGSRSDLFAIPMTWLPRVALTAVQ